MNPITLPIAELKPALTGLGKIITRSASLPVFNHVKIERTKEGWIGLTTTDIDRFITVRLEQPVKGEPMVLLLPYEELLKTIKNGSKHEDILVEPASKDLVIMRQGEMESRITTIPAEEFPPYPKLKENSIPIPDALRLSIYEAMCCASEDPQRHVLQGAFIDGKNIIATDGRQLYKSNTWNIPLKNSLIIPKHKFLAWSEFNKDGGWQLKTDGPFIQINSRRWRFISKKIEGQYPNWRQVMPDPKSVQSSIVIDPAAFKKLIQIIERLPCDNPEHFTIGLEWKDQCLSLLGRPPETKEWTRVLINEAKGDGKNVTVFMNRRLLNKALDFGLNAISIIDPISPLRIHQGSREMIVMPVRPDFIAQAPPPRVRVPRRTQRPKEPSAIDEALIQIGSVFSVFKSGLNSLRDLTAQLKGLKRTQKKKLSPLQDVRL